MNLLFYLLPGAFLAWSVWIYNRLVSARNTVLAAWSDIEVQLKRRHDLIPKLVEAVRRYAAYESATLTAVTALRTQSQGLRQVDRKGAVERELGRHLRDLIALAENYPELKASHSFLDLQHSLTEVEQNIQYARRYYNGAVRSLNVRIESFPNLIIARWFRFTPAQYFDYDNPV